MRKGKVIHRTPVVGVRGRPARAIANEIRRLDRILAGNVPPQQRPMILGARAGLQWVISNTEPRPSDLYRTVG